MTLSETLPPAPRAVPVSQVRIGPYTLRERIGVGGMGEVFRAQAPGGGEVAIKLLRPDVAAQPEVRRRFTREARAAASLQHDHIVQVLDFGAVGGEFFLAMELIEGGALGAWRWAPPDGETLLDVIDQILSALAYAHARGVIHRDLKPENVLLSFRADGRPCAKVMDFGVAFFRDELDLDIGGQQAVVGTPAYMSPEQALNLCDVSPATDLYAVGVVLYELLTGQRPYTGASSTATVVAHVNQPIPRALPRDGYRLFGDIDGLFARLLAKDPRDRFGFASEAQSALRRIRVAGIGRVDREREAERVAPTLDPTTLATVVLDGRARVESEPDNAVRLFALREPPFVGRREALHALRSAALETLAVGGLGVSVVTGESGMGRSRLVQQLRFVVEERGLMVAWAGMYDGSVDTPDLALVQAVRRGLGVSTLGPEEARARLSTLLERVAPGDTWERDALASMLAPSASGASVVVDEPSRWALLERTVERACRERPVLLVIEDVHLGGLDALRFLGAALRSRRTRQPWHVVVTVRSEVARTDARLATLLRALAERGGPRVSFVDCAPLTVDELMAATSASLALDPALARGVAVRSAGNPQVAVEMLRHLVDSGRLEGGGAAPSAEEVLRDVPTAVSALVRRRIAEATQATGQPAEALDALERLAFLGRRFDVRLAALAVGGAAALQALLQVAVQYSLIEEEDGDLLRFESELLRDVLCEVEPASAASLHAGAARCKIDAYGDRATGHAFEIGEHWRRASDPAQAAAWYRVAADVARRTGRFDAVEAAWRSVAECDDHADLDAVTLAICEAHVERARWLDAERDVITVTEAAASRGDAPPPEAVRLLAEVARRRGELRSARDRYATALRGFESVDDLVGAARTLLGLARLELRDGRLLNARSYLLRARDVSLGLGDDRSAADAMRELATVALWLAEPDDASALAAAARARFVDLGDRRGAALCALTLGDVARAKAEHKEAIDTYVAAHADLVATGDWHGAAVASLCLALTARDEARWSAARVGFAEAHETFQRLGDVHAATVAALHLGRAEIELGRWDAAEPLVRGVVERDAAERIDEPEFVAALVDTAHVALLDGRVDLSQTLLALANHKLNRTAVGTPLVDRIETVRYLLAELASAPDGDAVVHLLDDE